MEKITETSQTKPSKRPAENAVSVIIVTYNGARWIEACLKSVYQSTVPVDVLVLDNHSKDDTCDIIKANFPQVKLKRQGKNLGFGKANNVGITRAIKKGYNWAYLLNQDAKLLPDTLETLIAAASEDTDVAIASPLHLNYEGTGIDLQTYGYFTDNQVGHRILSALAFGAAPDAVYPMQMMPAAHWLMKLSAVEKIGAFDPIFPHRGEDNDYCARLNRMGYKLILVWNAHACHEHHGIKNITQLPDVFRYYQNKSLLALKNPTRRYLRNVLIDLWDVLVMPIRQFLLGRPQEAFGSFLHLIAWIKLVWKCRKRRAKGVNGKGPWL